MSSFDCIVITASNETQATGYRAQVAPMQGVLAPEIIVVPDPGGRRVGSLGSTVALLKNLGPRLAEKRVLVCHSGGDSKRLPAYAAIGKAFVPVPQGDGSVKSLFEVIVGNMSQLKLPKAGLLVVCGDVAPRFNYSACRFGRRGVIGVGYRDSMDEGSRHGVYVPEKGAGFLRKVAGFLQKPDAKTAKAAGALARGRVVVDTGILWMDAATCVKLAKTDWLEGDLYEKFTAELLRGFAPFSVNVVPTCEFFHIGSSRELLEQLGRGREWVEGCEIPRSEMKLAGGNIVTGVPRSYGTVALKRNECLLSLPIGRKDWVHIRYGLDDTFKTDGKWERFRMAELVRKVNHVRAAAFRRNAAVLVEKPLRIDFAGGWSDTPPICNENGGCVLNAAVTLNGVKPVKAFVRRLPTVEVVVESVDLKKRGVFTTDAEIADHADPSDWSCLVKSALTVVGYTMAEGGLYIRISAEVPKGSGMGTSSILGAALVEALGRVRGKDYSWQQVSDLTLRLEQEMHTGGGWQDQVGGLLPGVKLISSRPGVLQKIRVRLLSDADTAWLAKMMAERTLLYFTGQKRMARNVLRGVLNFYRENPCGIAAAIVDRLKRDAARSFDALCRHDWKGFCAAINGYWLSKKALDPGSTNPMIESTIARIAPWTDAVTLTGAGGGGFMFIVATDRAAKARLRAALEQYPPVVVGRFYDLALV